MYKIIKEHIYIEYYFPFDFEINILLFKSVNDADPITLKFDKDENFLFKIHIPLEYINHLYKIKIFYLKENKKNLCIINDPYTLSTTFSLDYLNPRFSKFYLDKYDWEDDSYINIEKKDLIIYETHIRDITAHFSSKSNELGTYKGFLDYNAIGGINHIKSLGVNAIEFLPIFDFSYIELPYLKEYNGKVNYWNPYETNHWGYMTSNFFSLTSLYSKPKDKLKPLEWVGLESSYITDFKKIVKFLHKEGIAVILDVVYNHYSEYECFNLKQLDQKDIFRQNIFGEFTNESYCGNDLNTSHPFIRHIIIQSLIYWVKEFHIDGFRFDLGNLIDKETLSLIKDELIKINPNVILIAEPWGGGYEPEKFSSLGYASWNDQLRNGIKGENPHNGLGWIFGSYYAGNNIDSIKNYIMGTLQNYENGLFESSEHSVNYLESHDGYTLSDFIRIANKTINYPINENDILTYSKLTIKELKYNKLAALFLFISNGILMLHEGQEFARSKVIHNVPLPCDENFGHLDHNTYNKDNETNYINYNLAEVNIDLLNYYKGLIHFRKNHKAFSYAKPENYIFTESIYSPFIISCELTFQNQTYFFVLNADQVLKAHIELPRGKWEILIDDKNSFMNSVNLIEAEISVPPISGIVLIKSERTTNL